MKNKNYASDIKTVIDELTGLCPTENMFHPNKEGEPFPSRAIMKDSIKLTRSILFPGFFGNASVNKTTLPYHIGVNVEKLFTMLGNKYMPVCVLIVKKKTLTWKLNAKKHLRLPFRL